MFYKSFRYFFILLYYFLVTLIGQTSRDAVIQIDTPYDGEVISDNYLVVRFNVAEFFEIGQEQCNNCDGYLKVSLDQNLIVSSRPNEGDLIYFPLAKKLFEISFVDHDDQFYQLSNLPVFKSKHAFNIG